MAEVNAADLRIIKSEDDVISLYAGAGGDARAGIETELAFFDPGDMAPMAVAQNETLKKAALAALPGDWLRNEPSSDFIEVNSLAGPPEHARTVLEDINLKIKTVSKKAAGIGLKRSYFQDLPGIAASRLLKTIMPVPRYQAFFVPPREDMAGFASYFTVCKSNQVSVSYRDPDHMLQNVRRLYLLAPFLFMLTDNGSGFREKEKFSGHAGMAYRHEGLLEGRGGVPLYLYTAKTGQEYIHNHIRHVLTNPLFVYYDEKGGILRLPAGKWTTFPELAVKGLNTASNYFLAQSVLWPDVKIAPLRNDKGEVYNHRYEARMLGVGIHQHQSAFLIVAGLAFNDDFAQKTDALLSRHGFSFDDPDALKTLLEKSYDAAREHGGKYFDIAYGTGSMSRFAKDFAKLLESACDGAGLDKEIAPLLTICRTGMTDARVNAKAFPALADALAFQREYDAAIFDDPNRCAYDVLKSHG